MPHCILELSNNVIDKPDFQALFKRMHESLASSGEVNLEQIKGRVRISDSFYIGGGLNNKSYIYLQLALMTGRTLELRQSFGAKLLEFIEQAFPFSKKDPNCSITVEVREMDRQTHFRSGE